MNTTKSALQKMSKKQLYAIYYRVRREFDSKLIKVNKTKGTKNEF